MAAAPDPALVDTFRRIRQDARSDPKPTDVAQPFTIVFTFDGVGQLPQLGDRVVLPVGRISGRIVGAVITTDGPGSATVNIARSNTGTWPNGANLTDTLPTITGTGPTSTLLDTSLWRITIQPDDIFVATLQAVTGTLTTVTLSLECVRQKWPSGSANVQDTGGNIIIDLSGNTVTQRN